LLLIGQAVEFTQKPAPHLLLPFRLAGKRKSNPHASAGVVDNGE
jgi:hypothetical protein